MARSFNGTTDRIDFANPFNFQGSALTVSAWVYPTDTANVGYISHIHPSGDANYGIGFRLQTGRNWSFFRNGTTEKYRFTNSGSWSSGSWQHMLSTDTSNFNTATDIKIYYEGSEVVYGAGQNGAGENSHGGSLSHGGRIYDDTRNLAGYVAEVGWWNRVLSSDEIAALVDGFSPVFIRNGLQSYTSLVRTALDQVTGSFGTLDGTSVIEHPPIIYPSAPVFYSMPTVAAGETLSVDIGPTNNTVQGVKVVG